MLAEAATPSLSALAFNDHPFCSPLNGEQRTFKSPAVRAAGLQRIAATHPAHLALASTMATGGRSMDDINAEYRKANPLREELTTAGSSSPRRSFSTTGSSARFSTAAPIVFGSESRESVSHIDVSLLTSSAQDTSPINAQTVSRFIFLVTLVWQVQRVSRSSMGES
jgi:hypothetical protein